MAIYHMICSEVAAAADAFASAIAQGEMQPVMWFATADFVSPLRYSSRWSALAEALNLPLGTKVTSNAAVCANLAGTTSVWGGFEGRIEQLGTKRD